MGAAKHVKKGKRWVKERYWHPRGDRKWSFHSDKEQLFNPAEVKIRRYVKVINTRNPYVDTEYFPDRQRNRKYEHGCRDKVFAM